MLSPAISYYNSQNEYLLAFTSFQTDSEYDINALRVDINLQLITTQPLDIAAETSKAEQKSQVIFNGDKQEYFIAYEYNNGTDWDVSARRVGDINGSLDINPERLDFGASQTSLMLQLTSFAKEVDTIDSSEQLPWFGLVYYTYDDTAWDSIVFDVNYIVQRDGLTIGPYEGDLTLDYNGFIYTVPVTMEVINIAPDTPSNPVPANGASDQSDFNFPPTALLSWDCSDFNVEQTLSYDVYFSNDQTFVNNADESVRVSTGQSATSYPSGSLDYDTTYYWRVEAKDDFATPVATMGDVWSFRTIKVPAPVLTPVANPTNNLRPALSWSTVTDAVSYHIQIDDEPGFSAPFIVDDNTLDTADYTLSSDLPEGNIYWRVASIDINGNEGAFSAYNSFLVDTIPLDIPELTPAADPTNDKTPTLTWSEVLDAVNYHIQISDNDGFIDPLVNKYISNTPYTSSSLTVDVDKDIYWRVSSVDPAGNESNFSEPDSFRLDVTAPPQITDLEASNDGDVTLFWSFIDSEGDFNHFNIYRDDDPISNVSMLDAEDLIDNTITNPATTTFVNTGAGSAVYFYAITAVDNAGNENKEVIGISNTSPDPGFIANPVAGYVPLEVNFYSTSTGYDQPLTYMWDIDNDGTTDSTDQDTSYIYNEIGLYSVKLTVTDYDNDSSSVFENDYISVCSPDYARIAGTTPVYYMSFLEAYFAAASSETIEITADTFAIDDLRLLRNISITMNGGYDCSFTNDTGLTVINGELRIQSGTVKLSNIRISP